MDEPGVAAECPPEQKEKEQEGARSEGVAGGGAGDRDLPTTDGVTTGATSAVAITIKNNPDTQTLDTAGGREAAWLQVTTSASKSSIRRFVTTEKAPTRAAIRHYANQTANLMIIASRTQFHTERPWGQRPFSIVS